MFELVVFIISVAIIYAAAARRFTEFPGEAERANFIAVVNQLQTAINLEMMLTMTRGQYQGVVQMEMANPMDMLLDPPSNYLGAYDFVDNTVINRRSWYYDLSRNELVYLVNDSEGVFLIANGRRQPTEEIRFSIQAKYRSRTLNSNLSVPVAAIGNGADSEAGNQRRGTPSGLLLEPVIPYEWGTDIMELVGSGVIDN